MFKRKKYSYEEPKQLSFIFFSIGGFLIIGNLIAAFFEGISTVFNISTISGVLFLLGVFLYRVRGTEDTYNQS
ncbi:hypothetical protein LS684_09940 [Cytobacillus spongiae]|jgi:predicted membrane channel-forming protein YqfA (hemolysin III family)|uniref:hypothetical protein n=1 Tax=Cytobacillus spongiae TaxID=2901381 RepID=UPI001F2DCB6C|nr:hypothetical protein [Cytobacillus spongiae]UII57710.1 hypothetical protein LS684_09940 [Cytobacillus spongiae]